MLHFYCHAECLVSRSSCIGFLATAIGYNLKNCITSKLIDKIKTKNIAFIRCRSWVGDSENARPDSGKTEERLDFRRKSWFHDLIFFVNKTSKIFRF